MCTFQTLYFSDNGYVVRCNECGHYQLGFASTMLTLLPDELAVLYKLVTRQIETGSGAENEHIRNTIIPTPYKGASFLLTVLELKQLHRMLEEADTEEKALSLIELFR